MSEFLQLLQSNRNYRYTWIGQVVSEIGDHFNNIAVFSLALANTRSGLVVSGIMLSRAIPAVMAGPMAGVVLDRLDRKRIMIASDLIRAVVALGFILAIPRSRHLAAVRAERAADVRVAVLHQRPLVDPAHHRQPRRTAHRQLADPDHAVDDADHRDVSGRHQRHAVRLPVGVRVQRAFVPVFGGCAFRGLRVARGGFRAAANRAHRRRGGAALARIHRRPALHALVAADLGIALVGVGWATGGGAAQILFSLFGELVFNRGPAGIGYLWAAAGVGLAGGRRVRALARASGFRSTAYKRTIGICYVIHGGAYVIFSQMRDFQLALVFIAISRAAVAVSSVLNMSQLLRHVPNEFRGRVFATMESLVWSTMMLSMTGAGVASQIWSPRTIGVVSGLLSSTTAIFWLWANWTGRLPEPAREGVEPEEMEVHGDPVV